MTKTARTNAQYNDKVITKMTLIQEIIKTIRKTKNTHAYIYIYTDEEHLPTVRRCLSRSACRAPSSKPAAARHCCGRPMGQTNGRTDNRPLHRPCSSYYADLLTWSDLLPEFIPCRRHIGLHVDASCFWDVPVHSIHYGDSDKNY